MASCLLTRKHSSSKEKGDTKQNNKCICIPVWFTGFRRIMKRSKKTLIRTRSYFDKEAPAVALRSLFDKYDADGNGMLDKQELYKLLQDDLGLDEEQCDIYRHLLDKDADSLISYPEFLIWFQSGEKFQTIKDKTRYYYLQKAISTFKKYDTDNNLALDEKEFHKLYKELGGEGKKEELEALSKIDVDHNGRVSFQEFMTWLNWVPLEHLIVEA